jgi:endonuclease III
MTTILFYWQNRRFSTLVSLMLSSQTKDEVTDAAVKKLRTAVGGTLSIDAIISADDATISDAIAKVGFWRRKTMSVYLFNRSEISYIFMFSTQLHQEGGFTVTG